MLSCQKKITKAARIVLQHVPIGTYFICIYWCVCTCSCIELEFAWRQKTSGNESLNERLVLNFKWVECISPGKTRGNCLHRQNNTCRVLRSQGKTRPNVNTKLCNNTSGKKTQQVKRHKHNFSRAFYGLARLLCNNLSNSVPRNLKRLWRH